jgi:hypothetical protein
MASGRVKDQVVGVRTQALDSAVWENSMWISAVDAEVVKGRITGRNKLAADGCSWFVSDVLNSQKVVSAVWMTAGLGVYDIYVNGELVDDSIVYANPYPESIAPSKEKHQSYAFNAGMSGREAIDEWFDNNKQIHNKKNTIQLVVIAAMHYGYYLEKGTYGAKGKSYTKIEVISGIADEIESQLKGIASEAGYKPSLTGISGYSELI